MVLFFAAASASKSVHHAQDASTALMHATALPIVRLHINTTAASSTATVSSVDPRVHRQHDEPVHAPGPAADAAANVAKLWDDARDIGLSVTSASWAAAVWTSADWASWHLSWHGWHVYAPWAEEPPPLTP